MSKNFIKKMEKITEKFGRAADNIKASMKKGASKEQIKEYSALEEAVLSAVNPQNLAIDLVEFETTREEIIAFLVGFVTETITEENLREKLLSALTNPDFLLEAYEGDDILYGGECSPKKVVDKNGNEYWTTQQRVCVGKDLGDGRVKSTFLHIRDVLHEAAHLASQKYDPEWMNFDLDKNPFDRVKDHSVGEIESKFLEKVLCGYVLKSASELCYNNQSFGLTEEELRRQMVMLRNEDVRQFLARLRMGKMSGTKDYKQSFSHRYVIGEVGSRLLCEEYKQKPQDTMDLFSYYMSLNANINIDQAVKILTEGKCTTYGEAMGAFKNFYTQNAGEDEMI